MSNLLKRILSGGIFLALMLVALLLNQYVFLAFMSVILVLMMNEFLKMTMGTEYKKSQILSIIAGLIIFLMSFLYRSGICAPKFGLLVLIPIFIVMVNALYVKDKTDFGKFANAYTAMLYIAVPLSVFNVVAFHQMGVFDGLLLLSFFAIVWASDSGAYLFGITLGQKYGKKLFPSISPKKSWMGFWGGLFTAILTSVGLHYLGIWDFHILHCIVLSVVMNVSGVYGDLIESQWKRYYCIKDSGKSMPGHGGMLDRFDSALLSIPCGLIYLYITNII